MSATSRKCFVCIRAESSSDDCAAAMRFAGAENLSLDRIYEFFRSEMSSAPLRAFLEDIQAQRVDAVVVVSMDVFAPYMDSLEKMTRFISDLQRLGTRFVSLDDGLDTSAAVADFLEALINSWDSLRGELRGVRLRRSFRRAREEGKTIGRPKLRDDEKIRALRRSGLSLREIAKELEISTWAVRAALNSNSNISH